jgi:tetratricopeptide (TPR) repeat protein
MDQKLYSCREHVLAYLAHGLVNNALSMLEYILVCDDFQDIVHWVDYYRLLLILEQQGRHRRVLGMAMKLVKRVTNIEAISAPQLLFMFTMLKAQRSLMEYETAEKLAESLQRIFNDCDALPAVIDADLLPSGYMPPLAWNVIRGQLGHFLAARRRQEGKFEECRSLIEYSIKQDEFSKEELVIESNRWLKVAKSKFRIGEYSACLEALQRLERVRGCVSPHLPFRYDLDVEPAGLVDIYAACYSELGMSLELFSLHQQLLKADSASKDYHFVAGLYNQLSGRHDDSQRHFA